MILLNHPYPELYINGIVLKIFKNIKKNLFTNLNFIILLSLQTDSVNIRYFKLLTIWTDKIHNLKYQRFAILSCKDIKFSIFLTLFCALYPSAFLYIIKMFFNMKISVWIKNLRRSFSQLIKIGILNRIIYISFKPHNLLLLLLKSNFQPVSIDLEQKSDWSY